MSRNLLVASILGFALVASAPIAAPVVSLEGWSQAQAAPSYKAKRWGHKKHYRKRGKAMHYQYNAPGSRFPGSWRY